jgi:excisionase family DNA binding protein
LRPLAGWHALEQPQSGEGSYAVSAPGPEQQHLLNIDEAAAYLNVPARWVADAVRQRKVRCTRIGKHVRFRTEHLEELISAGEQSVTTHTHPLAIVAQPRRRGGRSRL